MVPANSGVRGVNQVLSVAESYVGIRCVGNQSVAHNEYLVAVGPLVVQRTEA